MADEMPFLNIAETLFGPPPSVRVEREQQRGATERLGLTQGATEAERQRNLRIQNDAMRVWQDILSPSTGSGAPTNLNEALATFAKTPEFFALGTAGGNYIDIIRKLQTNPNAPLLVSPGQEAFREDPGTGRLNPTPEARVAPLPRARETNPLDKPRTDILEKLSLDGNSAREDLANLQELETALQRTGPGGFETGLRGLAAQYGINVRGKSELDVVNAILARLTPRQRVPGSGATTEGEMRVFARSLPNLLQSEEGRQRVLDVMLAHAQDRVERGDIAARVFGGEMDLDVAFRHLRNVDTLPTIRDNRDQALIQDVQRLHGIDATGVTSMNEQQLRQWTAQVAASLPPGQVPRAVQQLVARQARRIEANRNRGLSTP